MTRLLVFTPEAWKEYTFWQEQDKKTLRKINLLLKDCMRDPFEGIGKPEALRHELSGAWSRRIDESNRLVYEANDTEVMVISCRYHY